MVKKQSDVKEFSISVFIPAIRINYQYAAVMEHMKGIGCMCDGDMMRSYFFVTLGSVSARTYSVRLTVTLKKQQPKTGENLSEDNKLI